LIVSYKKRKIVLFITVCFFTCHQYVRYSISKDSIISPKTIGVKLPANPLSNRPYFRQ